MVKKSCRYTKMGICLSVRMPYHLSVGKGSRQHQGKVPLEPFAIERFTSFIPPPPRYIFKQRCGNVTPSK